ncbi:hypothetical protein BLA60_35315 [Actinophytocola xinjiangensis]|uniref:Uncharacterized protein n=1 Tax=Actinophytocola xinjiangensis TaxID=485602 RepID=A0A7Z0WF99_9PSEU|nr:hypothetical protein [Actinophytocola xinjiangensis]OLF05553.1 hypothetical protein BLA60_35315 [Actinophytocola xinjiangensis]
MAIKDAVPDIRPRAGHDLLVGIDGVLPRIGQPDADGDLAAEDLMTALVRCATCGDISRIREQAAAVRLAAAQLRAGLFERAAAELRLVRADLLP